MKAILRSLFLPRDPLSGQAYLAWGLGLFALKYLVDYLFASLIWGRSWWPTDYFLPRPEQEISRVATPSSRLAIMVMLAIPFVWIGVNLTIRRLRTIGWPTLLACLFFVPYVNFAFFGILSLKKPNSPQQTDQQNRGPRPIAANTFLLTFGLTAACIVIAVIAMLSARSYGWGLFVGIPFVTGFVPALSCRADEPPTFGAAFRVMISVQGLMALFFLIWKIEGAICLIMAAPISLVIGIIGITLGLAIRRISAVGSRRSEIASASFLLMPLLIFSESRLGLQPSVFKISSRIQIDAPPQRVWKSVVTFSELPPPNELIFRAGLAYPIRAEIRGQGVGAIRHCVFSTGPFVEPIIVWDEPSLLRFTVISNPPPMKELSFAEINPPHLHGFLESEQGQFELISRPNGKTELVGTTWYRHGLWPEAYWRLWSDYIIHTIHLRVLRHIKKDAEREG